MTQQEEPGNLGGVDTRLVGRERDLEQIHARLSSPAFRLITLTGPGGVGKTCLAQRAAAEAGPIFPDGVWMVDLASLADPVLVPQTVAAALGLDRAPGRPVMEVLVSHLQPRHLLLVLDNCERVARACAWVVRSLLGSCPHLSILVTSRESLHIAGEVIWSVRPLSAPDPDRPGSIERLQTYESVRLFVDRARKIVPAFTVSPDNAAAVVQIAHRLDGLPLAIELAAARLRLLSVAQIASRLDDRFRLLSSGDRLAPLHQKTLHGALDWSHDLLTQPERMLFRRLAVMAGSFELEAVEEIASGDGLDRAEIMDLLDHLIDKSLISVLVTHGRPRRYRMLETVRAYAQEKLQDAGEAFDWRRRHLAWCLALAEEVAPDIWGAATEASAQRLEVERENLRAAMTWSLREGRIEDCLRLTIALSWFWFVRADLEEGRYWLERALNADESDTTGWRAAALSAVGSLAAVQGDYEQASSFLEDGTAQALKRQFPDIAGWCLLQLGVVALLSNDLSRADGLLAEGQALFSGMKDRAGTISAELYRGLTACCLGDYARAEELLAPARFGLQEVGDTMGLSRALHGLGLVARQQKRFNESQHWFEEALQVARDKGARLEIVRSLEGLAGVACARGHHARAARLFGAADSLQHEIGVEIPHCFRSGVENDLAAARAGMGARAFESEWMAGQSVDLDRVAALPSAIQPARLYAAMEPSRPTMTRRQAMKKRYGGLTARERQVAILVARGRSNADIAEELVVTIRTVEAHMTHILAKLDYSSRSQVAVWAVETGLAERELPPEFL